MPRKAGVKAAKTQKKSEIEEKIVHNLVELQKIQTNLAEKFDNLATQISRLLGLFENTAKTFATNPLSQVSEKDRDFLEKIDKLIDQNKTIAKGLTLMEERIRERAVTQQAQPRQQLMQQTEQDEQPTQPSIASRPLPRF